MRARPLVTPRRAVRVSLLCLGGALLWAIWFFGRAVYAGLQTSERGFGLLLYARRGDAAGVKGMLAEGVDPNFRYVGDHHYRGDTPLRAARRNGHAEIVKLLQRAGARE